MKKKLGIVFCVLGIAVLSCLFLSPERSEINAQPIQNLTVNLNPYKLNDLVATVTFDTAVMAKARVVLNEKNDLPALSFSESSFSMHHRFQVVGLRPRVVNKVSIFWVDVNGKKFREDIDITTGRTLRRALIVVTRKTQPGNRFYALSEGIVFDEYGSIRSNYNAKGNLAYLMNGELYVENRNHGLVRYSLAGKYFDLYAWPAEFTSFTHGLGQKTNKNFLVIGSFKGTKALISGKEIGTQWDIILEIDYKSKEVVNQYDLAEILNPSRDTIIDSKVQEFGLSDWCHINGVDYDPSDDSIVASCRHSGIFKIDAKTKKLVWLITPKDGLDQSGRDGKGPAISDKVLTAVDEKGRPYDEDVQKGYRFTESFKWPVYNHNVRALGNNLFSVFDNAGLKVNNKNIQTSPTSFATIYKVDPEKNTVQQFWREDLGVYSAEGGLVTYRPQTNDVVVYISNIPHAEQDLMSYGLLRRYDAKTHEILFEALIYRGGEAYYYSAEEISLPEYSY